MKRTKRYPAVAGMGILLAIGVWGCGKGEEAIAPPEKIGLQTETSEEDVSSNGEKEEGPEDKTEENQPRAEAGMQEKAPAVQDEESGGESGSLAEKEPLSGKIQEMEADGMLLAQTTVWVNREGGSGEIMLVDEEEAEKIAVRFAEDVKVEYWRIEGGGAGIEKQDRTLSDLQVGDSVEMEGYYDNGVYVATLILIEEYV